MITYTNNGDGSHTVWDEGRRIGKVARTIDRKHWVARTESGRAAAGFDSIAQAAEQLREWWQSSEPCPRGAGSR